MYIMFLEHYILEFIGFKLKKVIQTSFARFKLVHCYVCQISGPGPWNLDELTFDLSFIFTIYTLTKKWDRSKVKSKFHGLWTSCPKCIQRYEGNMRYV